MHGELWGKTVVVVFRDDIILCVCKEERNIQMQVAKCKSFFMDIFQLLALQLQQHPFSIVVKPALCVAAQARVEQVRSLTSPAGGEQRLEKASP